MSDQQFDPPRHPYDETNVPQPEYRVRLVARYVVTRYCYPYTQRGGGFNVSGGSRVICEVPTEQGAYDIARAIAHLEGGTVQAD